MLCFIFGQSKPLTLITNSANIATHAVLMVPSTQKYIFLMLMSPKMSDLDFTDLYLCKGFH